MPRGGKREGAGRRAGVPNKVTGQNRETLTMLAQSYEQEAIETLVAIMRSLDAPHAARATCSNSILDRARGKAVAQVEISGEVTNYVVRAPAVVGNSDQWLEQQRKDVPLH